MRKEKREARSWPLATVYGCHLGDERNNLYLYIDVVKYIDTNCVVSTQLGVIVYLLLLFALTPCLFALAICLYILYLLLLFAISLLFSFVVCSYPAPPALSSPSFLPPVVLEIEYQDFSSQSFLP